MQAGGRTPSGRSAGRERRDGSRSATSSTSPRPSTSIDEPAVAVDSMIGARLARVDLQAVADDLFGVVGAALLLGALASAARTISSRSATSAR